MKIEVPCTQCGALLSRVPSRIQKSPKQFCDRVCKGKYRSLHYVGDKAPTPRTRMQVECANCKKPMEIAPNRVNRGGRLFCSYSCMGQYRSVHWKGEGSPTWQGGEIETACDQCGKVLHRHPYKANRGDHQFCNQKCMGAWVARHRIGPNHPLWQGGAPEETCDWCGKAYRRFRGKRDAKYTAQFCSRKCQSAWQDGKRTGAESPVWRGGNVGYYGPNWHAQKRAARKRDGYACQHCGKHQNKCRRALDVHHIQPFRTFGYIPGTNDHYLQANDLTNLITLCPQCHKQAEYAKIAIQPYLL